MNGMLTKRIEASRIEAPDSDYTKSRPRRCEPETTGRRNLCRWLIVAGCLATGLAAAQPTIPDTYVLPSSAADTSKPGFIWRVHQVNTPQPNNTARTEEQLAGLLGDNIANPAAQGVALGPSTPPSPSTSPITFEIDTVINLSLGGTENAGTFTPDGAFPGLPGTTGSDENVAAEILTWLDLPAGVITLGVNSDDGFKMTIGGATPSDLMATKVGEFEGGRSARDTLFSFTITQAGLYAARCTWEQGGGAADIEIFSVNPDNSRVLLNDTANGGIPAYRAVTVPARAYVRAVSPVAGAVRVPYRTPIMVELVEGDTVIDPASMTLSLNGQNVVPVSSKSGGVWTVSYTPPTPYAAGSQQDVVFGYLDGSAARSFAWSFQAIWVSSGGHFIADFDAGQPLGSLLYGKAYVDGSGGFGNSGVLKLTDAFHSGSWGWFSTEDFNGGGPVSAFHATFKLLIGGGEGADGFSFNFANDITDPPSGKAEEGTGTGLSIMFDTYNNGASEAPAIDVKCGGRTIASSYTDFFRTGDFVDVDIVLTEQGTLDLSVNGVVSFSGLPVPFTPAPGRFVLGARTGALTDNHWVDNLEITATTPSHPYVTSFTPTGPNIRWDALIHVVLKDVATAQLDPATVQLNVNGAAVMPSISKVGDTTTVSYQPRLLPPGENVVTLVYSDFTGQSQTFTRQFQVMQYIGPAGNFYEAVLVPNHITWPNARSAAETRTFFGHPGHLATITSFEEDLYLEFLRQGSGVGEDGQLWVGGYQVPGSAEPGEGWTWVNNEGAFPGDNYGPVYANWQFYPYYQPDNAYADKGGENYLAIGLEGFFGWNDDGYYAEGRRNGTLSGYIVEYEGVTSVRIDIKPGDQQNPVYLSSNGKIPVAILASPTFDPAAVDPATVRFGQTGTEAVPVSYGLSDVNGDKRKDLVCTFNTQDTALTCNDKSGQLRAKLCDGLFGIRGSDSINPLNCPQFSLSLLGLQDVRKLTDLLLTVNVVNQNVTPPTFAQHVQCKSLDLLGRLRWTTNIPNVALTPTPANTSVAMFSFAGLEHGEPIKAAMEVPSGLGANNLILRGQGLVLFRPDLAVNRVDAPGSVGAGVPVNFPILIEERNGDLGATATVYLMEGETVLDWRQNVYVGPHQMATVVFSAVFSQVGTRQLKVVIGDVDPGDYDLSNNERTFSIEVTQPPAYYDAYYFWEKRELAYGHGYEFWWYETNYFNGKQETFYENLSIPVALEFPLENLLVAISADGTEKVALELSNLAADWVYDDGFGYSQSGLWRELGPNFYLYVWSVRDPWGYQYSSANLSKYAGDYVYYSAYHDLYWGGGYEDSGAVNVGTFFEATSAIDVRFVLQSADGSAYGGAANIPLYYYSWDYPPSEYHDPWSGYFQIDAVNRGEAVQGWNSGYITP